MDAADSTPWGSVEELKNPLLSPLNFSQNKKEVVEMIGIYITIFAIDVVLYLVYLRCSELYNKIHILEKRIEDLRKYIYDEE